MQVCKLEKAAVDNHIKSFEAWQETVHPSIRNDPLRRFQVYQKAIFAYDLAWEDCEYLLKDKRGKEVAVQLIRSEGNCVQTYLVTFR